MSGNSRQVTTNQTGIHNNLVPIVQKHLITEYQAPIKAHSHDAFTKVRDTMEKQGGPFILDACCGTGDSTRALASAHPEHLVIGIDRSEARLTKETDETTPANAQLVRTDLMDFYRLAADAQMRFDKHFLLYPNPYPKASQLQRRWHASPVFPTLIKLGGTLELRSNWQIYLQEFALALQQCDIGSSVREYHPSDAPLTLFEKKYHTSGQPLWQLVADLP
jgi:tRNA G46 methylase TrmB